MFNKLCEAIENGDLETFSKLVGNDAALRNGVNAVGSWLHEACDKGQLPIVKYLVEHGADINTLADADITPLDSAGTNGHAAIVRYLLSVGARLDVHSPDVNALFGAIVGGHAEIAKILMEAGIDPHVVYRSVTGKLKNALSFARERGHQEIVNLLLAAGCRLPVEGVDVPIWAPDTGPAPPTDKAARQAIIAHMANMFGPVDSLALQEIVPVSDTVRVAINVIRPGKKHRCLTLFTTGMSDAAMPVPPGGEGYQYAELVMHLPAEWPMPVPHSEEGDSFWPFQWLRNAAYFPHLNETWLGGPVTIISSDEPPVPLGPNTTLTCLLLIADFAKLNPLVIDEHKVVRFYTAIPLYTEERDFELKHGIKPLIQRLHKHGYTSIVDVDRKNVALD